MEYAITVKNLVKKYKKATVNAVDDLSFNVKEGAFFAFLGPNGAGKTTAISILTTTLSKTSGEITVAGFDIEKQSNEVRKNIGIIFQNPSLDLNLTAEENIRFHAILYNLYPYRPLFSMMPQSYKDKVMELAEIIGIKNELSKPVRTFSGGMKRKLEIVRSLIHNPKVLFLDEPTTGLDPASRKNLWEYLKKVREELKTTIFLTTHYLEEAEEADEVIIINKGKIIAQGTPKQIKEDLVEEFLNVKSRDNEGLKKELDSLHLKYKEIDGKFKISVGEKNSGEEIHQIIKKINTPLIDIDIHLPTLEEAYLEIIHNSSENNHV